MQRELKSTIGQREKEIEGHTSKVSLTHISHNQLLQTRNIDMKGLMEERRNLEAKVSRKNAEIETLNLKVQQMMGYHKRAIDKLEEELTQVRAEHSQWLEKQDKETNEWQDERKELDSKVDQLGKSIHDIKKRNSERENKLDEAINEKGLEIARLSGTIVELEGKTKQLFSKNQVEVENVEKTMLETRTIMNTEKERLMDTSKREKDLQHGETRRVRDEQERQMDDLRKENNILLDNYQKAQIREEELKGDVRKLVDTVNDRSNLEERVINIGLSNNYFKNVAEVFKRESSL